MTERLDLPVLDRLVRLGTATIGEVARDTVRIIDGAIRPLASVGSGVAGQAVTVTCTPGDNLALHLALLTVGRGDLLVVDYGGSVETGPFGEILALAAQGRGSNSVALSPAVGRGARGLVIDGAVRDSAEIAAMQFPVYCRGLAIPGTTKTDRGRIGEGCRVGGTEVRQGDVVVADQDAIVVFDPRHTSGILARGTERLEAEARIMDRIRKGETTCDILGLS